MSRSVLFSDLSGASLESREWGAGKTGGSEGNLFMPYFATQTVNYGEGTTGRLRREDYRSET